MNKKVLSIFLVLIFVFVSFAVSEARMFDQRSGKIFKSGEEITFDNLPHLADFAYSGIYVEDTVKISGVSKNANDVKIIFPGGKTITLPIVDKTKNYFEKVITFNDEGTYKIDPLNESFEVCYRAIPINATFLKDIVSERISNDDSDKNFVNWNNAIALEEYEPSTWSHAVPIFSFLIIDSIDDPIPNLKGKRFVTDESGIATIPANPINPIVYGDIRVVGYKKFVFDKDGQFEYNPWSKKLKNGFVSDRKLFIDVKDFIRNVLGENYTNDITMGDKFIMFKNGIAYPAIIKNKDNSVFVNAESVLVSINNRSLGIMGTAIEYYGDRIVLYVAYSSGR